MGVGCGSPQCTFQLEILGVKKNPNGQMYSQLGVLTKGTIIEVGAKTQYEPRKSLHESPILRSEAPIKSSFRCPPPHVVQEEVLRHTVY